MALEIAVIGWFLGIRISFGNLLVLNALMTVSEYIFIMVPGKFGSTECSLALGFGGCELRGGEEFCCTAYRNDGAGYSEWN